MSAATPAELPREAAQRLLDGCPLHAAIGLELLDWDASRVRFAFRPPALVRSDGAGVHGGAIATALDTAACFAVIAAVGHDCGTLDLRTDFVRPVTGAELSVTGTVRRAGRRFAFADATVETLPGTLLASARGVFTW